MSKGILDQEFLSMYYQVQISDIQSCLAETADRHNTTATEVTKIVIDSTEMKLHLLPYEVVIPMISTLSIESIISLCKTSKYLAVICKDDRVWWFLLKRDFGLTRKKIKGSREDYIRRSRFKPMISCGDRFTGYITKDKELYMWGQNVKGQLGNGTLSHGEDTSEPHLILTKCIKHQFPNIFFFY